MMVEINGVKYSTTPTVEIPIEAIVDGEVVTVDTKAVPIIPRKVIDPS